MGRLSAGPGGISSATAASTYLPIAGPTYTGTLNGPSASLYNAATSIALQIGASSKVTLTSTALTLGTIDAVFPNASLGNTTGLKFTANATTQSVSSCQIGSTNTTLFGYNAPTGFTHSFTIAGTEVLSIGNPNIVLANTVNLKLTGIGAANQFLSATSSGAAITSRAIVAADIPSLSATYLPIAGGTMTGNLIPYTNFGGAGNSNVLFGDATTGHPATISGSYNVAIGVGAGLSLTSGLYNVFVGHQAAGTMASGGANVAVGYQTLYTATSSNNVAIGKYAGFPTSSGGDNTFLGFQAGYIGGSGYVGNTTGSNLTFVGSGACGNANNLTNAIALGYQSVVTASNTTVIGNSSTTSTSLGGGTFQAPLGFTNTKTSLAISTTYTVIAATAANGSYLISDDSGGNCYFQVSGSTITIQTATSYYTNVAPTSGQIQILIASSALKITTGSALPASVTKSWVIPLAV